MKKKNIMLMLLVFFSSWCQASTPTTQPAGSIPLNFAQISKAVEQKNTKALLREMFPDKNEKNFKWHLLNAKMAQDSKMTFYNSVSIIYDSQNDETEIKIIFPGKMKHKAALIARAAVEKGGFKETAKGAYESESGGKMKIMGGGVSLKFTKRKSQDAAEGPVELFFLQNPSLRTIEKNFLRSVVSTRDCRVIAKKGGDLKFPSVTVKIDSRMLHMQLKNGSLTYLEVEFGADDKGSKFIKAKQYLSKNGKKVFDSFDKIERSEIEEDASVFLIKKKNKSSLAVLRSIGKVDRIEDSPYRFDLSLFYLNKKGYLRVRGLAVVPWTKLLSKKKIAIAQSVLPATRPAKEAETTSKPETIGNRGQSPIYLT